MVSLCFGVLCASLRLISAFLRGVLDFIFDIDTVNYEDNDVLAKQWGSVQGLFGFVCQPVLGIIFAVITKSTISVWLVVVMVLQVILVVIECILILNPQKALIKFWNLEKPHCEARRIISIALIIVWSVNLLIVASVLM